MGHAGTTGGRGSGYFGVLRLANSSKRRLISSISSESVRSVNSRIVISYA